MTREYERHFYCNACRKRMKTSGRQFHFASKAHREARGAETRKVRKETEKRLAVMSDAPERSQ